MARAPLVNTTNLRDHKKVLPLCPKLEPRGSNLENQIPHSACQHDRQEAIKTTGVPAKSSVRIMNSGPCTFTVGTMSCNCAQGLYVTYPGTGQVNEECQVCSHSSAVHQDPRRQEDFSRTKTKQDAPVSNVWTPRPYPVQEIVERAMKLRVVLIRGTPACGKTILMRLMHKYILEVFPYYTVHTFLGWPQDMKSIESQVYLKQHIGMEPQLARHNLVFIDDAQSSYYDDQLWSSFKLLEMDSAVFILLSSYGSPGMYPAEVKTGTPPIFSPSQRISLQKEQCADGKPVGILLEYDEAYDLVSRYLLSQPSQPTLTEDLVSYIMTTSGGHAGALAGLLETIISDSCILANCGRNGSQFRISLADFIEVFQSEPTSKRLRKGLKNKRFARGLPLRADLQRDLSIADFLNEMARKEMVEVGDAERPALKHGATTSYFRGWIHKSLNNEKKEVYVFASPIHRWHCQALLRKHVQCSINAASPLALVVEILKYMKPCKLALPPKKPSTQSASRPPEDWYTKEFYRASEKVMNGGILWSPEFGTKGVRGSGSIDFYLGSHKWGVEFTRDGDQLSSHYGRFQPGGNYHRWILDGELLDWVLLDFRSAIPINRHKNFPKLFHICFSMDFSRVKVLDHNLDILHEFALINI